MPNIFDTFERIFAKILEQDIFSWLPISVRKEWLVQEIVDRNLEAVAGINEGEYVTYINVPQDEYPLWSANMNDFEAIGELVSEGISQQSGAETSPLRIKLFPSPQLKRGEVSVSVKAQIPPLEETALLTTRDVQPEQVIQPGAPCLVIPGTNPVVIDKSVFNLGRKQENDLPIDDPRVSRKHAQIRTNGEVCVLVDLGSTGGTFVNGVQVTSKQLTRGDIISLAGFVLIFDRDPSEGADLQDDQNEKTISGKPGKNSPLEYIG